MERVIPVKKIDLTDKDGTLLSTEKKYCRHNILVLPKLNALEITENGTYPVPDGFAGNGQVKVSVMPKKETALIVTGNGTYVAPPGTVYTSVVVNVPTESGGDSPHVHKYTSEVIDPSCTMGGYTKYICDCGHSYIADTTAPLMHSYVDGVCERCGEKIPAVEPEVDTGSYAVIVGDVFSIPYHGSSPVVDYWPTCLTYYDDGGELVFTAIAAGSGVIRLTRNDSLIGEYTVTVAIVEAYDYDLKIGEQFSVVYDGSSPTVECPSCLTYYDDGGEFVFTASIVGTGTLWLYRSDSLIASYTIRVSKADVGSDTHVHSFTHTVTSPTCTEAGYTTHTCTICGFSYRDTPVAAHHVPGEPVRVREATCCIPPEYVVCCTRCGEEIYRYEDDGGFADHIADGGRITTQPTCTTQGVKTYYCRECFTLMKEELVAPTGHAYTSVVTPPTCTTEGYTTHTCEKCGHTYRSGKVAANGHIWVAKEHSGFSSGYGYVCSVCGALGEELSQHVHEHTWVPRENVGFSSGYGYVCSECGELGEELSPPTCDHDYTVEVTEPTCTAGGITKYTCSCGDTYEETTEALGHDGGKPQLTNTPTCTVCAHYAVTCTRCGFLINEYDDDGEFGDHSFSTIEFAPTCTEAGYTRYVCDVCHEVRDFPGDAALGHDYKLEPDPSQSLGASMVCTRCGDSYEASYDCDILGHETSDGAYDVDGEEKYKCKHCGEFY